MSTVYFITGAARGLGKAFVEKYLARPNSVVIATVRDPAAATAKALEELPKGSGSNLHLLKLDSSSEADHAAAIKTIEGAGVDHIDVAIANAGIANDWSRVDELAVKSLAQHMDTNVYGVVYLFQSILPLLNKSQNPRFIGMGSLLGSIGSIGGMPNVKFPCAGYGPTKAAIEWIFKKIHVENNNLVSFVVDPGLVATDMGSTAAEKFGFGKAPVTTEDSINGMTAIIDNATRDKTSGKFWSAKGTETPW